MVTSYDLGATSLRPPFAIGEWNPPPPATASTTASATAYIADSSSSRPPATARSTSSQLLSFTNHSVYPEADPGDIPLSRPNWHAANTHGAGKVHLTGRAAKFGDRTLNSWYNDVHTFDPLRTHTRVDYDRKPTHLVKIHGGIAEPAAVGANREYYVRRAAPIGEDGEPSYRRTLRYIPEPLGIPSNPFNRIQRKRQIPHPEPVVYDPTGIKEYPIESSRRPASEPAEMRQPDLMHRGRPDPLATCLRETDEQALFEASLGRKYRSHPTVFQGTGRAGDTSTTKGAPRRNEDRPEFFKDLNRDSPTFLKYLANLPAKAATSPHHRRQLWETQRQRAAADGDRRLVASLKIAGVTDD